MANRRKERISDSDQFYNIRTILGKEIYEKVSNVIICLFGAGGIGSNLALTLMGCGFRRFKIIDGDIVSLRNIPLSSVFNTSDIGKPKAEIVKNLLLMKSSKLDIQHYNKWDFEIYPEILEDCDIVIIGVDSNQARERINALCVPMKKPTINLGFHGWEGAFQFIIPHFTACWSCLFRPNQEDHKQVKLMKKRNQCPQPEPNVPGGVLKSGIDHLMGFTSNQILKFISNSGSLCQYYHFDSLNDEIDMRSFKEGNFIKPDPMCPVCQKKEVIDIANIA